MNFVWIAPLRIKKANYSTHLSFGGRLYCFSQGYVLTTRSEMIIQYDAIDGHTRDTAGHIRAKLRLFFTVVLISRPIGPCKKLPFLTGFSLFVHMYYCSKSFILRPWQASRSQYLDKAVRLFLHLVICKLRPGADQSSKAAFGKSAFAKTCFLLLKIRLAHTNLAKSKNAFEHVLARFRRKHFARCTWPDHCFLRSKDALSKSKSASSKSAFTKS